MLPTNIILVLRSCERTARLNVEHPKDRSWDIMFLFRTTLINAWWLSEFESILYKGLPHRLACNIPLSCTNPEDGSRWLRLKPNGDSVNKLPSANIGNWCDRTKYAQMQSSRSFEVSCKYIWWFFMAEIWWINHWLSINIHSPVLSIIYHY